MKHEHPYEKSRKGMQLVTFRLGIEYYGIMVSKVREILRPLDLFPVPGMGTNVEGVINLRGEIIPIVKMHLILGIGSAEGSETARKRRVIIVDASCGSFGFFVDAVLEVTRIQDEDLQQAPELGVSGPHSNVVSGIAKVSGRMVVCLDSDKLIPDDLMAKELVIGR
ncbi:MAG: chemotaxis protein CheW [Candidatus Krumholzibacteria bacterium]|nr:chemotaxis protein CheW [Candidatus Krumholzibacteria bacterium]